MPVQHAVPIGADAAFWMAVILATFTILFGTRHLDASERHEGMVAAMAFESLVKLVAFLAVGVFITWGIYGGLGDIFGRAAANPRLAPLRAARRRGRQLRQLGLAHRAVDARDHVPAAPVPDRGRREHQREPPGKAIWLFPLYMLAMNVFVLPIAFGGVMHFPAGGVDPDTFVLTVPMAEKQEALALLVFIGGLSAATGMVIVETIALSTMGATTW